MTIRATQSAALALLALLHGCAWYTDADYPITAAENAAYMTELSPSVPAMPADGYSRMRITASLLDPAAGHAVVFTTTAGTFAGGKDTIEVPVDGGGKATAELTAGTRITTVRVDARVKSAPHVMRSLEVAFTTPVLDSVLRFIEVPSRVEADGASVHAVTIATDPALFDGTRKVALRVSPGRFAESNAAQIDAPIGQSSRSTLHLISPEQTGFATLTATIGDFTRTHTIELVPALPHSIVVDVGVFRLKAGSEHSQQITAHLRRSRGRVSQGTPVRFEASDSLGRSVDTFRFRAILPSNAEGNATAQFTAGDTPYRGWVRIRAHVDGAPAVGEGRIDIVAP